MTEHKCNLGGPWPTGHPLPPEDPDKVRGPELGAIVRYRDATYPRWDGLLMRIKERSYVWSPGECRSNGGHRLYDDSVVEWPVLNRYGEVVFKTMVVSDRKLEVVP